MIVWQRIFFVFLLQYLLVACCQFAWAQPSPADAERSVLTHPSFFVDVHRAERIPAAAVIAHEYLYYSEYAPQGIPFLRRLGRNVWAVPLVRPAEKPILVLEHECIVKLEPGPNGLLVHVRDRDPSNASVDRLLSVTREPGGGFSVSRAFPSILGERRQGIGRARLAFALRPSETALLEWFGVVEDKLFWFVGGLGDGANRFVLFDIFQASGGRPLRREMGRQDQAGWFSSFVTNGSFVFMGYDGNHSIAGQPLGRLLVGRVEQNTVTDLRLVGHPTLLPQGAWTSLPAETPADDSSRPRIGIRYPRHLSASPHGLIGVDATPVDSESQNVFYYAPSSRMFYRVSHLSNDLRRITGLSFYLGGMVVADDSDEHIIRWYGTRSPFPATFTPRNLADIRPRGGS